jgi:uncharacterized membrane protein YfcA
MILALVLAVGIGVSLGLLGGGGSILTLPILVYVLGMETKQAIATSLLVVGVTSAAAMVPHARARRVNGRIGLAFGASSMAGAFLGGHVAHFLPSGALLVSFAIMMLVTGLAMLRGRAPSAALVGRRPWGRILLVGVAVGLLTGVIGAGGGFVIVPALALLCGLSMPEAIATSLLVIALNSFSGFAGSIAHVTLDFRVAALVTTASVVGSIPGAFAAGRVPEAALRRTFAWLVLAMAAFMLWRQTSPLWGLAAILAVIIGAWVVRRRTVPASRDDLRAQGTQPKAGRLLRTGGSS